LRWLSALRLRHGAVTWAALTRTTVHRALGRIELGLAQLAIIVGVGRGEPGITHLLHAQFAVGLVQVAVLVEVELVEARGQARIGLGFLAADAAVLVDVQLGPALAAVATATVLPARQFIARELAVLVLVQFVELRRQTRVGSGFAAVDDAVAIGVQLGRALRRRGRGVGRQRDTRSRCRAAGPAAGGYGS